MSRLADMWFEFDFASKKIASFIKKYSEESCFKSRNCLQIALRKENEFFL